MTRITDMAVSADGTPYILTDDGAIFGRLPITHTRYQGMPPSKRPTSEWVAILGPEGVTPTRLFLAGDKLSVLADGVLYERQRDPSYLHGQRYGWQPVEISLGEPK